jgi:deoxyribose-phosphate aldolase
MKLNKYIDHTLLKASAAKNDILKLRFKNSLLIK